MKIYPVVSNAIKIKVELSNGSMFELTEDGKDSLHIGAIGGDTTVSTLNLETIEWEAVLTEMSVSITKSDWPKPQ